MGVICFYIFKIILISHLQSIFVKQFLLSFITKSKYTSTLFSCSIKLFSDLYPPLFLYFFSPFPHLSFKTFLSFVLRSAGKSRYFPIYVGFILGIIWSLCVCVYVCVKVFVLSVLYFAWYVHYHVFVLEIYFCVHAIYVCT